MTLLERRELYWNMYFCAEGLKKIAPELINQYNDEPYQYSDSGACIAFRSLPPGLCYLIERLDGPVRYTEIMLPELATQKPEKAHGTFWFKKSDWKIRQIAILEAIKLTYEND